MRETAERCGKVLLEALCKYRTYVDNTLAGASSIERLRQLSQEPLDTVATRGGFQFNETLMSGDPSADPSEPRKVPGLILETRKPTSGGIKLNTGGALVREDADLEANLNEAIPEANTIYISFLKCLTKTSSYLAMV
jgi:hypothetical protein